MKGQHILCGVFFLLMLSCSIQRGEIKMVFIPDSTVRKAGNRLTEMHGPKQIPRIEKGLKQVQAFWRKEAGTKEEFIEFAKTHFISDSLLLQKTLARYEKQFESIYGHMAEISRDVLEPLHVDIGPMLPVDYLFANYAPDAHVMDDLFKTKIAFVALLNFPLYTLKEKLELGHTWSRTQWAQARLADAFSARVPSDVLQWQTQAYVDAEDYISNYNIWMHHVLDENGERLFPPGLKLISHWGLRDELKAQYANPEGLKKQRLIQRIMERIILQEIPKTVINNPSVDWNVEKNTVTIAPEGERESGEVPSSLDTSREPDLRYAKWLAIFQAEKKLDLYYPTMPSLIARRFERDREIPEAKVEELLVSILSSKEVRSTAKLIEKRLRRPLEPFDIWYNGFKASSIPESQLDRRVMQKYPTVQAFQKDIPHLLIKLDFPPDLAHFIASKIAVDPARGSGHAMEPGRKEDKAHLRTRVPSGGMNYKGYNIACHELGHNVEQVLSLNHVDSYLLRGVPNTAFTEAFAFIFQKKDLELLEMPFQDRKRELYDALDALWSTYEIGGVSLVDMRAWHWLYDHPNASSEEFKKAVIQIAKDVWNQYFADVFGKRDVILLAIYSHMVNSGLYLPDYPLGHIIAFQIESYLKGKRLGIEMERMCRLGSITPDLWMQLAVGESISTRPLLKSAKKALEVLEVQ